jgi:hypothetical protein
MRIGPGWRHVLIGAVGPGALLVTLLGAVPPVAAESSITVGRFDGFNVVAAPGHPYGGASAQLALRRAKRIGATAIAIVPFLWQATPASSDIVRGADMSDDALRVAIRQAHMAGLAVIVKPHVWVPQSWAGAVAPTSESDWRSWFAGYRHAIEDIAQIAAAEHAEALAVGTELAKTSHRPEWREVIAAARSAYAGPLVYFGHNTEEAERVPFWSQLDAIGVTLYPPLGPDHDRDGRLAIMRAEADKLDALATAVGRPVVVGEIGLRSAVGAAAKPWESAEERESPPDPALQAAVLGDWIAVLRRPAIHGVLVWRWFTDPDAGGATDTDFTVQGKPTESVLRCAWLPRCGQ